MDFIKKAKAQLKELESDLNKATAALGLNNKDEPASAVTPTPLSTSSATSTSTNTPVNTPGTSAAPSAVAAKPSVKLPLAVRKNLRDYWEPEKPQLEARLSALMGVPWIVDIDIGGVYAYAKEGYAKDNPGKMITKYITDTITNLEEFLRKYGEDGKVELNTLASSHSVTLVPSESVHYSGCDVASGSLRILFNEKYLGTNIQQATFEIGAAVNKAGALAAASAGAIPLSFDARNSIKNEYEAKIGEVQAKVTKLLALPFVTFTPNFEHNYTEVAKFEKEAGSNSVPRDWQKRFGAHIFGYFEGFVNTLDFIGFGKDDMLQEGFQEAIEKNEISLRIVDKLVKGTYNEVIIENGVLVIQTVPKYWNANIRDPANGLVALL